MFKKIILSITFALFSTFISAQEINHLFYEVNFEENTNKISWVKWILTKDMLQNNNERANNFKDDPATEKEENDTPYANSGYDRGHLCPSADMRFAEIAQNECFYLTNIIPQTPQLNRILWKKTEEMTRDMVEGGWIAIVYSGCLYPEITRYLDKQLTIPVPEYCWKVLIFIKNKQIICVGFKFPNSDDSNKKIDDYIVDIKTLPCPIKLDKNAIINNASMILKKEK